MLKYRILTAVILIPLVLTAILWLDAFWFCLILTSIMVLGAWEWGTICGMNKISSGFYCLFTVSIIALLFYLDNRQLNYSIILIGSLLWLGALGAVVSYQYQKNVISNSPIILMMIGECLLIPTWTSLYFLKTLPNVGSHLLLLLMFLIWGADSGAYFIGRKWGKTRLASRVSPGKTWEGTAAGVISGLLIAVFYVIVSYGNLNNQLMFIGISIFTVLMSIVGDLMESMVKRIANIKDSGSILPGHGGIMDRIDSLTAAGPVFTLGIILSSPVT